MKIAAGLKSSTAVLCLLSGTALAQQQSAQITGVEEIVVTAQRRSEDLQTVPIALTAFTASELQRRQVTRTLDLISYIPNLNGNNNTGLGSANVYYLRGVGSTELLAVFDPPVGTYVDEFYNARQNQNNFGFFDVERIEVLRGPQGTLYGRNTTGGSVNLYLKKPAEEIGGFVEIGYGQYDQKMGRVSFDLPVIEDKFLTKWSAFFVKDAGYVHNQTTGENNNDQDTYGLRGATQIRFSDSARWDFSTDLIHERYSNLLNFPGPNGGRVNYTPQSKYAGLGPARISAGLANIPLGNNSKQIQLISNFSVELNADTTFNAITGFHHFRQKFMTDGGDGLNSAAPNVLNGVLLTVVRGNSTPLVNDGRNDEFTQELKVNGSFAGGAVDYVTGFYFFYEKSLTNFATDTITPAGAVSSQVDRNLNNRTDAFAGYTQFDWNFSEQFKATAGIRFTNEAKSVEFIPNALPAGLTRLNPPFSTIDIVNNGVPVRQNVNIWTPRFALNYQANEDMLLYASATRGFKSGGWNGRSAAAQQTLAFGPEKAWTYEVGIKSEWLENRLRTNFNAFYNNVSDFQGASAVVDRVTNLPVFLTQNFATLRVKGFEGEITAVPVDNLNLYWSFGYQKGHYANLAQSILDQQATCLATQATTRTRCGAAIVKLDGTIGEPVRAPRVTSSLGFTYSIPLGGDIQLDTAATWAYSAKAWVASANLPGTQQPNRSLFNAGIALRNPDAGWAIMADCTNCSNKRYVASFITFQYPNEPVRWLIHAKYDF